VHAITTYSQVQEVGRVLNRSITCLDEYLETLRAIFTQLKAAGAVAFKDQSAYQRTLAYDNPTRAQAEAPFNWLMEDPRRSLSYPDGVKPLSDYLFHQFMRMARDLDLPVQIHTGHMAGTRNEISKTNAVGLTRLIELHRDTRFDLFHANWPYSGEILFMAKNYPNVAIDFCWAHMVDPFYSQALLRQVIASVPHAKIHGFGSDLGGSTLTQAWAHADLARENIAIALADLVEADYLDLDEAKEIAYDWLFANPNQFFQLGLA
jgi:predicted TIM-barrel fold metal-dependent hydrolase